MRSEDLDDLLDDVERWRAESEALIAHGEPARALILLIRALRRDPPRSLASELWVLKSRALEQLGHIEQALEAANRAVTVDASSAAARARRATVYSRQGRTAEAAADCAVAVELEPTNATYWVMWGSRLNILGRSEEALTAIDRSLALDAHHMGAWQQKAMALAQLQRLEQSLAAYDEAIALSAHDPQTQARVLADKATTLGQAGRYAEELEVSRRAAKQDGCLASAYGLQGAALLQLGVPAEALALYKKNVQLDPTDVYGWIGLGATLNQLDRPSEAAEAYAQALALEPTHSDVSYWRGRALVRAWLTSDEQNRTHIDTDPALQDPQVWLDEAWNLYSHRQYAPSLLGAEEALRLEPANTAALGLKIRILLRHGQARQAFSAFLQRLAYDGQVIQARHAARRNRSA